MPERFKIAFLKYTEELDLYGRRHIADLIEKKGSSFGIDPEDPVRDIVEDQGAESRVEVERHCGIRNRAQGVRKNFLRTGTDDNAWDISGLKLLGACQFFLPKCFNSGAQMNNCFNFVTDFETKCLNSGAQMEFRFNLVTFLEISLPEVSNSRKFK